MRVKTPLFPISCYIILPNLELQNIYCASQHLSGSLPPLYCFLAPTHSPSICPPACPSCQVPLKSTQWVRGPPSQPHSPVPHASPAAPTHSTMTPFTTGTNRCSTRVSEELEYWQRQRRGETNHLVVRLLDTTSMVGKRHLLASET